MVVALVSSQGKKEERRRVKFFDQDSFDYGDYADPNESPVCGACIQIRGPLGSAKATIQDKVK